MQNKLVLFTKPKAKEQSMNAVVPPQQIFMPQNDFIVHKTDNVEQNSASLTISLESGQNVNDVSSVSAAIPSSNVSSVSAATAIPSSNVVDPIVKRTTTSVENSGRCRYVGVKTRHIESIEKFKNLLTYLIES